MNNKRLEDLIRSSLYDEYHLKALLKENNFNVPDHILLDQIFQPLIVHLETSSACIYCTS